MNDDLKNAMISINKHDTQLHMVEFLAHVRRFADFTRKEVDTFNTEFWNLMIKHFGMAVEDRMRLYE